jgi:hypothetical protein
LLSAQAILRNGADHVNKNLAPGVMALYNQVVQRRAILIFTSVYFVICAIYFFWSIAMTEPGYPLDDSWIYQVFARNIVTGHGFSFNPDMPISGATAPLWTLILAALWPLAGPIAGGLILGAILEWLALIAVYKIALALTDDEGLAFKLLILCAICWILIWGALSGMEVGLYSALSLWGLYFYLKTNSFEHPRNYLVYLMFSLAIVSRPECALFLAAVIIRDFYEWVRRPVRTFYPWLGRAAIVAAVLTPYFAFNFSTTGSIFPQTFTAKTEQRGLMSAVVNGDLKRVVKSLTIYPYVYLQDFLIRLLYISPILTIPFVTGILKSVSIEDALKSKRVMLALLVMLYVPLMGTFSPVHSSGTYHHMRLIHNIVPLVFFYGLAGLFWNSGAMENPYPRLILFAALGLSIAGGLLILFNKQIVDVGARYLVQDFSKFAEADFRISVQLVREIGRNVIVLGLFVAAGVFLCVDKVQRAIQSRSLKAAILAVTFGYFAFFTAIRADYYAYNVKNINEMDKAVGLYLRGLSDARSVAVNDIGAIGYFSGIRVLDLKGLISPEIKPAMTIDDSLAFEYMYYHDRVDYVAIFPGWFSYIPTRTDLLRPVKMITVERNTILAYDTTIVYRAEWPDTTLNAPPPPQ